MSKRFSLFFLFLFSFHLYAAAQKDSLLYNGRISSALRTLLTAKTKNDSVDVVIAVENAAELNVVTKGKSRLVSAYRPAGVMVLRIKMGYVLDVITQKGVLFADAAKTPKEELTTGYLDLAPNKLNYAQARFPEIKGSSILASVKEQQFDTADIDYKGRYVASGVAAPSVTTHAAIMATTLAGAGNSSPFARGAAPEALLTSSSFASLLPDADSVYRHHGISVQNHSYGTVVESYYGAEAAAYDRSVLQNPTLVHVFSAGNSGAVTPATGIYAGLAGFSNLTGNFKASKNSIAVGATDSFNIVSSASSRGPVLDGRVKPELVAFGEDGSSGAAALVSGTVALVQQAYKNKFNELPPAALVKAVLLNSADDAGRKGIDYAAGYGSVNGYAAVKTILEDRLYEDALTAGETKQFSITVPPNTAQLKITLVWTDTTAAANASKALVNNLDIALKNETTRETWLPWVLNATPNADSLVKEAVRKKDTLNNVEQISIDYPAAGTYVLEVKGTEIVSTRQSFAIAYGADTAHHFAWTFPTTTDAVIGGKNNVLRWQTTINEMATLSYTTNGTNWKVIADGVDLDQHYFKWEVPDTMTTAQLRMEFSGAFQSVTSDTFVISKAVNLQAGFNCADSFLLYWNNLPAAQYAIYQLANQYLEPVTKVQDTAVLLKKEQHPSIHYSVAPLVNGREGIKSFTLNYTGQGADCYFRSFYVQSQTSNGATFSALIGSLYNVASVSLQKQSGKDFVSITNIMQPTSTSFIFSDSALTQGVNNYRVQLTLRNGAVVYSNDVRIYHFPNASVIVYPNPAVQAQPIQIITNGAGRHTVEIYSANGTLVHTMALRDIVNTMPPLRLSKGIYFIHIINDEGKRSTQKLVVL